MIPPAGGPPGQYRPRRHPILALFAPAFSAGVFPRAPLLAGACILGTGRRTSSNLLRRLGWRGPRAASSYHKVLSQAHWSGRRLAALLTRFLLGHLWPRGPVPLVGDDTVAITAVRRWLWADWVVATAGHEEAFAKLPEPVRDALLYALAPAA